MSDQGYFPLGDSDVPGGRATATCYCGAIRLEFVRDPFAVALLTLTNNQPTEGDGLVDTFICNCTDCRKLTSSMFASNFIVKDSEIKYIRGVDKISRFTQKATIESGNYMTTEFCSVCGRFGPSQEL